MVTESPADEIGETSDSIQDDSLPANGRRAWHPDEASLTPTALDRIEECVVWTELSRTLDSQIVRKMYLWTFIVPMAVKLLSNVPAEVVLGTAQHHITLTVQLPFSWKVLYFASLSLTLGNLLFRAFCPRLIRDHDSAADFTASGKIKAHLFWYARAARIDTRFLPVTDDLAEVFWQVHVRANLSHRMIRWLAGIFSYAGLGAAAIVSLQTVYFVAQQIVK